jgi:hypothetical protein
MKRCTNYHAHIEARRATFNPDSTAQLSYIGPAATTVPSYKLGYGWGGGCLRHSHLFCGTERQGSLLGNFKNRVKAMVLVSPALNQNQYQNQLVTIVLSRQTMVLVF